MSCFKMFTLFCNLIWAGTLFHVFVPCFYYHVEQVTNRYEELLNEDFDEIIMHVVANNTEHESEESIMNKFRTLNESIKNSHMAFSGILRKSDKPDLNQKITRINFNSVQFNLFKHLVNYKVNCRMVKIRIIFIGINFHWYQPPRISRS